jgi:hypothetical protein
MEIDRMNGTSAKPAGYADPSFALEGKRVFVAGHVGPGSDLESDSRQNGLGLESDTHAAA